MPLVVGVENSSAIGVGSDGMRGSHINANTLSECAREVMVCLEEINWDLARFRLCDIGQIQQKASSNLEYLARLCVWKPPSHVADISGTSKFRSDGIYTSVSLMGRCIYCTALRYTSCTISHYGDICCVLLELLLCTWEKKEGIAKP